jgi:hypothetical protein
MYVGMVQEAKYPGKKFRQATLRGGILFRG